ncbi:MAG: dihydrofolate reductase [Muribaculaceae bacterium]|nr:dihydrofolate reductase [Muribaculaceae bacterium]
MKTIKAIVAVDENGAIGRQGDLLCHLPADMRHFKEMTMGHSIVMGRKTFESFPRRPLPGRQNLVITRSAGWQYPGVTVAHSLEQAIAKAETDTVFIIGGAQIYEQALPVVDVLHLTLIHARWASADVYFPALDPNQWQEVEREHHTSDHRNAYEYDFITLKRRDQA